MLSEETRMPRPSIVLVGIVLWVSFLSAGAATMLFFATFDPQEIARLATYPLELDPLSGYSIGFLLFWVLLICNSLAVLWLSNTKLP